MTWGPSWLPCVLWLSHATHQPTTIVRTTETRSNSIYPMLYIVVAVASMFFPVVTFQPPMHPMLPPRHLHLLHPKPFPKLRQALSSQPQSPPSTALTNTPSSCPPRCTTCDPRYSYHSITTYKNNPLSKLLNHDLTASLLAVFSFQLLLPPGDCPVQRQQTRLHHRRPRQPLPLPGTAESTTFGHCTTWWIPLLGLTSLHSLAG